MAVLSINIIYTAGDICFQCFNLLLVVLSWWYESCSAQLQQRIV